MLWPLLAQVYLISLQWTFYIQLGDIIMFLLAHLTRCKRLWQQHQQRQAQYSEWIHHALPACVLTNNDHMVINHDFIHSPPPAAYLPSHQHDAIDNIFSCLLFTESNPPECSTCFKRYHGMCLQGTQCDRCYRETHSHCHGLLQHDSIRSQCESMWPYE